MDELSKKMIHEFIFDNWYRSLVLATPWIFVIILAVDSMLFDHPTIELDDDE